MRKFNTLHHTWYCKLPMITLLLQCDPLFHPFPYMMKHSPNVLLSLLSLSEDHPQPVCEINFIKRFLPWDSEDSLSETIHPLLISFPLKVLRNLLLLFPLPSSFSCLINLDRLWFRRWSECVDSVPVDRWEVRGIDRYRSLSVGRRLADAVDRFLRRKGRVGEEMTSIDVQSDPSIDLRHGLSIDMYPLTSVDTNVIRRNSWSF
ncbi:hypothetical protein IGI04_036170 [Brassica rapa subsp. trilocularis]|uniref:F-box domain-containing protein n=1 Tax=Brassica rapa subsp. trilocularis TaxID=1813537 RepID=A0ABQ7LGH2_BRACM|nr:hypothetical protein IGI04_036170 [Brassica rapa subsp. trilocularis]